MTDHQAEELARKLKGMGGGFAAIGVLAVLGFISAALIEATEGNLGLTLVLAVAALVTGMQAAWIQAVSNALSEVLLRLLSPSEQAATQSTGQGAPERPSAQERAREAKQVQAADARYRRVVLSLLLIGLLLVGAYVAYSMLSGHAGGASSP